MTTAAADCKIIILFNDSYDNNYYVFFFFFLTLSRILKNIVNDTCSDCIVSIDMRSYHDSS